jgi:hypothetical protein
MTRLALFAVLALAATATARGQGGGGLAGCFKVDSIPAVEHRFAIAPRCTAAWAESLSSARAETRSISQGNLALVGGRTAVDALRAAYERKPSPIGVGILVNAMATTGSAEDIAFLKAQIAQPDPSDAWPAIHAAINALAFLRVTDARDRLREIAAGSPGRFTGVAAARALEMLDRPPCADSVDAVGPALDRELVRIVMECRPQALGKQSLYADDATGRVWQFSGDTWRARGRAAADTIGGTITTRIVHVPAEGIAFVNFGMRCGSLCGEGWTYRLRRTGKTWRIISGTFEWVS